MLFNTIDFLYFFILVVTVYFIMPKRYTWVLLLASSYFFYMYWKPIYILLIVFSTFVDYFSAIMIEKSTTKVKKKLFLILSLCSNLGLLFVFKYFNFFSEIFTDGFFTHKLLLPVGISFYTFQTLSYTIDVYRGRTKAERHFGIFALYVSFFPQLVAGPIERSHHLLPQFRKKRSFDGLRILEGLQQMAWGLFKKVVIADRAAIIVNEVYGNLEAYSGGYLILATIAFAFQIYSDFSGYSDIAIGSAKVLGFDLMKNFNEPYLSKSIRDFWSRWHISLSTWFRDYLYFPLGGSKKGLAWMYINMMIIFVVSGLWHGAAFTFIVWGLYHGILNALEKSLGYKGNILTIPITFILVNIGWVFFRASSVTESWVIIKKMFMDFNFSSGLLNLQHLEINVLLISAVFMLLIERLSHKIKVNPSLRTLGLSFVVLLITVFGVYGSYEKIQFIYFAF